jgi:hypothetical protein
MPSNKNYYGSQKPCRDKYIKMLVKEDISSIYQFPGHIKGHTYQNKIVKHYHPNMYACPL